ncbi:MAG TPA: family 1 glycosylhydrolase [Candidatus Dormibacteraeota bacterium]|jgi:beta-glucosidase|nr:family 1 glycosylhydrolase [Candidatus Dormibacteraeota bacterium]
MEEPGVRRFPDGFLWGCSTAAHQVEGGNHNNDWWEWERSGHILTGDNSDPSCEQWDRFAADFQLQAELANNAHRLSIEWSRVEPSEGQFDEEAIEHYRQVLTELRRLGQAPMVTLHHFSSPSWFTARGGWAARGAPSAWLPFVDRVAEELGELVALWCTINEPNIYAYQGWMSGEFPPGHKGDVPGLFKVLANMRRAHIAAYRLLGRRTPGVPVGLAHHKWLMLPARPRRSDRAAVGVARLAMERWPVGGRLARVVDAPGDFIGLNHYTGSLCSPAMLPAEGFIRRTNPPGMEENDFGWAQNPRWMRTCLQEMHRLRPDLPLYITESGTAVRDDRRREAFLEATLEEVWLAIAEGCDVRGYFHWTSVDNFEWARGYAMQFGLIGLDLETQRRTIKPSGRLFAEIARTNALPVP